MRMGFLNHRALLFIFLNKTFRTQFLCHIFQTGTGTTLAIRIFEMHPHQCFANQQYLRLFNKFFQQQSAHRLRRQTSGSPDFKTFDAVLLGGNKTNVVHAAQTTIRRAAGKVHFKLARELLRQRVAQKILGKAACVHRHIGIFSRAGAGQKTCRHITYGITAGFARCQANRIEPSQKCRHIIQIHKICLNILTRRHVSKFLRSLGQ